MDILIAKYEHGMYSVALIHRIWKLTSYHPYKERSKFRHAATNLLSHVDVTWHKEMYLATRAANLVLFSTQAVVRERRYVYQRRKRLPLPGNQPTLCRGMQPRWHRLIPFHFRVCRRGTSRYDRPFHVNKLLVGKVRVFETAILGWFWEKRLNHVVLFTSLLLSAWRRLFSPVEKH